MPRKFKVILTGATGYVGEGVLLECLAHPAVEQVLLVGRRPYQGRHPKIKQCIVPDFLDLEHAAAELRGYDACFYCAGISSVGLSEADYSRVTLETTVSFAARLASLNPDMVLCHVSGREVEARSADSMWARVKWNTEKALLGLGYGRVYNIRAGFMKPTPGQRNVNTPYRIIATLYPLLRRLFPNQVGSMREVGTAMINCVLKGYPHASLEVADIRVLAQA